MDSTKPYTLQLSLIERSHIQSTLIDNEKDKLPFTHTKICKVARDSDLHLPMHAENSV